ncbi:MAG: OmpA family protein [bacterium]
MNTSRHAQPRQSSLRRTPARCAYLLAFLIWSPVFFLYYDAFGQLTVAVNPAHTSDPRALYVNPAVPASSLPRTYLGLKLIYPGIVENNTFGLKSSLFNISFPKFTRWQVAAGFHGQYFSSPLYSESRFGLALAKSLIEQLHVGIDFAIHSRHYNSENFDGVDPRDPVFQKGDGISVFDPSAGVIYHLNDAITAAVALQHFSQPRISLGSSEFRQPLETVLGLSLTKSFVRLDLGAKYWQNQFRPIYGAEFSDQAIGRLRLGFALNNAALEGQLVLRRNASLFYSFNLPTSDLNLVSAGSHEIGLVYEFKAKGGREEEAAARRKQAETDFKLKASGPPPLLASLRATVDTVAITESREIREELPLIPRVFFAQNSYTLAQSRYDLLPETQSAKFHQSVREINSAYRNLLNIVADRLRKQPDAVVTVRGFSPGPPVESGPQDISRQRAQYVRDHLVNVLAVDARQVRAELGKPEIAEAAAHDPLRLEELQRVDLEVSSQLEETIFAPIVSEKKEIDALPRQCGFIVHNLQPGAGLRSWRLTIMSRGDTVEVLAGGKALPDTIWWNWQFDPNRISDFWREVRASLQLSDEAGQTFSTPWVTIGSKQTRTAAARIEKIPLILFAFDEYELDRTSARLRAKLKQIAGKLASEPQASCLLYGYTDEIGEVEHNYQLSVKRARNVLRELTQLGVGPSRMSFQGYGESAQLADNRLPEGRMLNRRVEVHIRKVK